MTKFNKSTATVTELNARIDRYNASAAPVVGTRVLTIDGMDVDDSTVVHSVRSRHGMILIEIADSGGPNTSELFNADDCTFTVQP